MTPPSLEAMQDKLAKQVRGDMMEAYINQLRAGAKVKLTDGSPAAKTASGNAPAAATAAKP